MTRRVSARHHKGGSGVRVYVGVLTLSIWEVIGLAAHYGAQGKDAHVRCLRRYAEKCAARAAQVKP